MKPRLLGKDGSRGVTEHERFHFLTATFDVHKAVRMIEKHPRRPVTIGVEGAAEFLGLHPDGKEDFFALIGHDEKYAATLTQEDCMRPGIMLRLDPKYGRVMLIDGWHRVAAALRLGIKEFPVYLLSPSEALKVCIDDAARDIILKPRSRRKYAADLRDEIYAELIARDPGSLRREKERLRKRMKQAKPWSDTISWEPELTIKAGTYKPPKLFDTPTAMPVEHGIDANRFKKGTYVDSPDGKWRYANTYLPRGVALNTYWFGWNRGDVVFDGPIEIPALYECIGAGKGECRFSSSPWMSLTPYEMLSMRDGAKCAHGRVVIAGLGLGYQLRLVAQRPEVREIILVEIDPGLVDWLLPVIKETMGPAARKIRSVIIGDAYKVMPALKADVALVDIFAGWGDIQDEMARLKGSCKGIKEWWGWGETTDEPLICGECGDAYPEMDMTQCDNCGEHFCENCLGDECEECGNRICMGCAKLVDGRVLCESCAEEAEDGEDAAVHPAFLKGPEDELREVFIKMVGQKFVESKDRTEVYVDKGKVRSFDATRSTYKFLAESVQLPGKDDPVAKLWNEWKEEHALLVEADRWTPTTLEDGFFDFLKRKNFKLRVVVRDNTYNFDNNLDEVLLYRILETGKGTWEDPIWTHVLLQVHQGGDVRGNYSDPELFVLAADGFGSFACAELGCDNPACSAVWRTDDAYHWELDEEYYRLKTPIPIISTLPGLGPAHPKAMAAMELDELCKRGLLRANEHNRLLCPLCGKGRLSMPGEEFEEDERASREKTKKKKGQSVLFGAIHPEHLSYPPEQPRYKLYGDRARRAFKACPNCGQELPKERQFGDYPEQIDWIGWHDGDEYEIKMDDDGLYRGRWARECKNCDTYWEASFVTREHPIKEWNRICEEWFAEHGPDGFPPPEEFEDTFELVDIYCEPERERYRKWFVNVYLVEQHYGGPEEGGWWYDVGDPISSKRVRSRQDAYALKKRLEDEYKKKPEERSFEDIYEEEDDPFAKDYDDYDDSSYVGPGKIQVHVENREARRYPDERPRWMGAVHPVHRKHWLEEFNGFLTYSGPHRSYPEDPKGIELVYEFPNKYKVSAIKHSTSYGHQADLWEAAIIYGGRFVFDTGIGNPHDVTGWLDDDDLAGFLYAVSLLPSQEDDVHTAIHPMHLGHSAHRVYVVAVIASRGYDKKGLEGVRYDRYLIDIDSKEYEEKSGRWWCDWRLSKTGNDIELPNCRDCVSIWIDATRYDYPDHFDEMVKLEEAWTESIETVSPEAAEKLLAHRDGLLLSGINIP